MNPPLFYLELSEFPKPIWMVRLKLLSQEPGLNWNKLIGRRCHIFDGPLMAVDLSAASLAVAAEPPERKKLLQIVKGGLGRLLIGPI